MRRVGLALLVVGLGGCDVLNPMMEQEKVKPFRPSDFYADGIAMRPPPPGVVPAKGWQPPELALGTGSDGALVQRTPVKVTPELLDVGRKKFEVHCAVCHGLVGDGESLVAKNMSQRPPPSLHERVLAADGHYYKVVSNGFGVMPGYASSLTVEERWAVVAYVRALQLSQLARLDQVPPEERARLEREKGQGR